MKHETWSRCQILTFDAVMYILCTFIHSYTVLMSICLSGCVSVCLPVFWSFRLCVCVHGNSKNNWSINLKREHIAVYKNSSDEHCPIKVKHRARL